MGTDEAVRLLLARDLLRLEYLFSFSCSDVAFRPAGTHPFTRALHIWRILQQRSTVRPSVGYFCYLRKICGKEGGDALEERWWSGEGDPLPEVLENWAVCRTVLLQPSRSKRVAQKCLITHSALCICFCGTFAKNNFNFNLWRAFLNRSGINLWRLVFFSLTL